MTGGSITRTARALLAGPGESRALCRSIDWSATSLGRVEDWPPALRAAVAICFESQGAIAVWAGPDLLLIHNDGYIPVLGPRYPSAMGRPAREVWSELWPELGPEMEAALREGRPARHEDAGFRLRRGGEGEDEGFFTYSFTPIREEDGRVVGVLNLVEETTAGVRARLRREELSAFALATAQVGAWDLDLEDHTAHRSAEHDRIFGYSPLLPRWTYETFLEHVLPEDRPGVDRSFRHAVETGREWSFECRIARRDGAVRWIWAAGCHRADERGRRRLAGIVQDVTERKRAEQTLRDTGARQAFLLELSDTLRTLADPAQVKAAAAAAISRRLRVAAAGYVEVEPDGELAFAGGEYGDGRLPSVRGWHRLSDHGAIADAVRSGEDLFIENLAGDHRLRGGVPEATRALGLRSAAVLPLLKAGRLVACLYAIDPEPRPWPEEDRTILREVAERTWAAVERAQAEKAVRESEEKYRTLFDSIDEGFCIIEVLFEGERAVDYRFVQVNPAFEKHTGIARAEGRRVREMVPRHEEHWFEIYGRVALTGESTRFESAAAALGRHYDVYAFRVGAPDLRRVAVLFNDITHRRRAEESLREAQSRLEEADRRKDHFLAILSHELRNPLTPLKNSLYLLDHAAPGGDQARRARDVIGRQVEQLSRLVDDLLDVTRITRGKIQLQRRRLELNELVRRTLEDHRMLFEGAALEVRLVPAPQEVFVHADWSRVAQVVSNLLQNAAKFTPPGGRVTVTVAADLPAGQALIRVADDGAGMAPDLLGRLFEPFMQADTTLDRSQGGLGLGLALLKGLVEQHGGSVEVRSEGLGRGSEFTVRLPLDREGDAERPAGEPPPQRASRRVLVIEDNVDAADSLREVLELNGHQVAVAYSGPDGLSRARELRPDVVLCDIGLPGMDGYAVARAFRADEELKAARLVALSGYALPDDLERSASAGFDRHVAKPPSLEQLEGILASVPPR